MRAKGRYYRITDDLGIQNRWFLKVPIGGNGIEIDPDVLTRGQPADIIRPIRIPLREQGSALDFTLCDFDVPLVSRRTADLISSVAGGDVQIIPVDIDANKISGNYEILNVLCSTLCLDETKSEYIKWSSSDGRPEKTGQYRMITKLVIDATRTENKPIFRIQGWEIALIVSDQLREAMKSSGITGVKFLSVETSG